MKRLVSGLIGIVYLMSTLSASAEVKMSTRSQINEGNLYGYVVKGDTLYVSYGGLKLYDMETGALLRKHEADYGDRVLDVSDDEAWTVMSDSYRGIRIYNQYGEVSKELRSLEYQGEAYQLYDTTQAKFLPGTSTLVIATDEDQLIFYDVEREAVQFVRGLDTSGELLVSDTYIALGYRQSIILLDHNGRSVHEMMEDRTILSYDLNRNGQLAYNTDDGMVTLHENPLVEGETTKLGVTSAIHLDETGTFIGTKGGRVYDTGSWKRIYTNMTSGMVDFNETTSRVFTVGDGPIKVYDAFNLKKRIDSVKIQLGKSELMEGIALTPSILVTGKDGSTTVVTDKIVWRTSNSQVAYFSQGKLLLKAPGRVSLKATYEDHEVTLDITVKKDPRPSDAEWLKLQKQTLEKKRTFLNAPYRLYSEYNPIKGVAGKFYLDQDLIMRGKYKDNWLYGTYRGTKKVDEILLFLDYEKRDITADEVRKVFGKPLWDIEVDGSTSRLIRGTKTIDRAELSTFTLHPINKKHGLFIFYDLEGKATSFYFTESMPSG